jgi:uncharacterized protein (TIGR03083 family)
MLSELDPFDIFDTEASRLDRFFAGLGDEEWNRPSRCQGWSVRDVLAHLAGEELYNHACLDGDLGRLRMTLERAVNQCGGHRVHTALESVGRPDFSRRVGSQCHGSIEPDHRVWQRRRI